MTQPLFVSNVTATDLTGQTGEGPAGADRLTMGRFVEGLLPRLQLPFAGFCRVGR